MIAKLRSGACIGLMVLLGATQAQAVINNDASVVQLKKDCAGVDDCFTTMTSVTDWLWNTRKPTATSRVTVAMGPSDFGRFVCPSANPRNGYVTLLGSGRDATRIVPIPGEGVGIIATDCEELAFQDLSVEASNLYALRWDGDGSSTWTNVDVTNDAADVWFEACGAENKQLHYWFNVRLRAPGRVFPARCSENWFYGSELTVDPVPGMNVYGGIAASNNAKFFLFGSVVRVRIVAGTPSAEFVPIGGMSLFGIIAQSGASVHMHGGIVSMLADQSNQSYDVVGVASGGGTVHTPGTAFNISAAGTGTAIRAGGTGVQSPFQWPAGTTPPAITSIAGSDTFVETDCDASGNCDTALVAEQRPHMMIYADQCTAAGPWYDMATNKCRGE